MADFFSECSASYIRDMDGLVALSQSYVLKMNAAIRRCVLMTTLMELVRDDTLKKMLLPMEAKFKAMMLEKIIYYKQKKELIIIFTVNGYSNIERLIIPDNKREVVEKWAGENQFIN